jgi:hypothetical protein
VLVGGKMSSLFDTVEDKDHGPCLDELVGIYKENQSA